MKIILNILCLLGPVGSLWASGLDLTLTYGSRYVGMGGQQIAVVDDAYSAFYNPAGLMGIDNMAFAANSANLLMQYEAPIGAANQQMKSKLSWGPLFYVGGGYRLTDRVVVGLGVYPTALQGGKFLNVNYGGKIGKHDLGNQLMRIELAPSVAIRLFDYVSIGMSYRAGYTRFENYGGVFGPIPIYESTRLSGWDAKGFKIGAKLDDFHGFSAALTWRFKMSTTLDGETKRQTGLTVLSAGLTEEATSTQLKVQIPAQLQAGLSYEFLPDRALVAFAYEFTQNDIIKDINIKNKETGATYSYLPLHYENGHTFHLGGEYVLRFSEERRLRTQLGAVMDRRVTNPNYPAPAIPPANHYFGYAAGAQYEWAKHILGFAVNYGQYSSQAKNVKSNDEIPGLPAGSNVVFDGKYGLKVLYVVADYQFHF